MRRRNDDDFSVILFNGKFKKKVLTQILAAKAGFYMTVNALVHNSGGNSFWEFSKVVADCHMMVELFIPYFVFDYDNCSYMSIP